MDDDVKESYLFSWDKIPGEDNRRLIDFLKLNFGIDWVKTENIKKSDDGRAIILSDEKKTSLQLNKGKTRAILTIDNDITDAFTVKTENGKLNIYKYSNLKDDVKESYLFSWDEIPGNDSGRLKKFLKKNFCVNWVDTAEVKKSDDGRTVNISDGKNSILLKLNGEETKAILTIDNVGTDAFAVKMGNYKLNIYNNTFATLLYL